MKHGVFLTAQWRMLVLLNYEMPPALLAPFVPRGTEMDTWNGKTYASLVGFQFTDTRLWGMRIPFHHDFEEVNLRFYVRREGSEGWRRGVVFVKELVPRWAIAAVARWCYNENYQTLPMRRAIVQASPEEPPTARYSWHRNGQWEGLHAEGFGATALPAPGSLEEFITEHYWGYTAQRDGGTLEYRVEHPRWPVWSTRQAQFTGDARGLYGDAFADAFHRPPESAFIAGGSEVAVYRGIRI